MEKLYDRIIWHNGTTPAINETNLNKMSKALDDVDDRMIQIAGDVLVTVPQLQAMLEHTEDIMEQIEELSQNPPYIGANGNWYVWDTNTGEYVDSGVDASITVTIADVTALAPDAQPYVTNTGTSTDPVFHLFIPRGEKGEKGDPGDVDAKITSSAPYTFRQGIGTMADMEIVGGTVAWNQLINKSFVTSTEKNGITITNNNDGTVTFDGTATADTTQTFRENNASSILGVGHKFLAISDANKTSNVMFYVTYPNGSLYFIAYHTNNKNISIVIDAVNGVRTVVILVENGDVVDDFTTSIQLIDLTQLFGSTIADAIYAMEQETAGAGVAFFRKYFSKDYYPYDAGSLKSVEGLQSRDVRGFNQWDEEWESGIYNNETGAKEPNQNAIRSKNLIHVLPSTTYCSTSSDSFGTHKVYFDANGDFVRYVYNNRVDGKVIFTTPANACYMGWWTSQGITTYSNDTCLNLSDSSKNGTYEPYHGHSYSLDSSLTLRGIPKLDSNNKLYYDGDIYLAEGSVERKYGVVDLGTLDWSSSSPELHIFRSTSLTNIAKGSSAGSIPSNAICSMYTILGYSPLSQSDNMCFGMSYNGSLSFINHSYLDVTAFATAMSGVMLVYELATPTTESAQPYQNPQRAYSDGTEEFVMNGIVPVGNDTTYHLAKSLIPAEDYTDGAVRVVQTVADGKAGKDMISDAWVSGQAYAVGDYCIYGNMIYRCVQAVTQGTAILPTNTSYWTPTKIATEIGSLNSRLVYKPGDTYDLDTMLFRDTVDGQSVLVGATYRFGYYYKPYDWYFMFLDLDKPMDDSVTSISASVLNPHDSIGWFIAKHIETDADYIHKTYTLTVQKTADRTRIVIVIKPTEGTRPSSTVNIYQRFNECTVRFTFN